MQQVRVGVFGVLRNDSGQILLVHQPRQDRWSLPGGGVRFGESPGAALAREVAEETALQVRRHTLIGTHDNVYDPGDGIQRHGIRLLYAIEADGEITDPENQEVDGTAWFAPDELPVNSTDWVVAAVNLCFDR